MGIKFICLYKFVIFPILILSYTSKHVVYSTPTDDVGLVFLPEAELIILVCIIFFAGGMFLCELKK